ncbi:MAG: sigma 54-interacting transcriptional regulator, partial [Thermoguttaceae bacterium]
MGRNRVTTAALTRLLNSAAEPIYVLDDELTIVFCNRACLDWLGSAAEGLLGRRCAYHSSPDSTGPDAVAARLCPPASAMAGRQATATVSCSRGDGHATHRRARFLPLQGTDDTVDMLALVAILDREDAEGPLDGSDVSTPSVHEAESPELHEQIRAFRRQAAGRYRADRLLGTSPAVRKARRQIELAAAGHGSVLLVGPPGSGRQHTAAAIHYGSGGSTSGSLIPLACSVLGPELIRSTLSALASGHSLGEAAGNSALLLNEVDELSHELQEELVALLVDRPFPLRLIATAGRPLEPLVRQAGYCEELAAALGTITIELPALCDRREDIPLLAQAF